MNHLLGVLSDGTEPGKLVCTTSRDRGAKDAQMAIPEIPEIESSPEPEPSSEPDHLPPIRGEDDAADAMVFIKVGEGGSVIIREDAGRVIVSKGLRSWQLEAILGGLGILLAANVGAWISHEFGFFVLMCLGFPWALRVVRGLLDIPHMRAT